MISFLTENIIYKVYSIYESIYLKQKSTSSNENHFEETDILISVHYGDPNSAIFLYSGKHIIISGCGLSIYDIDKKKEIHILAEPDNIWWTNGLHQDDLDDVNTEFRFVSTFKENETRVYKMNISTMKISIVL